MPQDAVKSAARSAVRDRRAVYGKGSIYQHGTTGRWMAQGSAQNPDGTRARPTFSGETREDAEAQLLHWQTTGERPPRRRKNERRLYHPPVKANPLRLSRLEVIERLVHTSRRLAWSDAELVEYINAQLSRQRLAHGVYGPCVYCGTWAAGQVDHVVPRSKGGTNEPTNLVSACLQCNYSKHDRSLEEWAT